MARNTGRGSVAGQSDGRWPRAKAGGLSGPVPTGAYEALRKVRHDCPLVLWSGRYGSTIACRCGWASPHYATGLGASYAWAEHVRESASAPPGICQHGTSRHHCATCASAPSGPPP